MTVVSNVVSAFSNYFTSVKIIIVAIKIDDRYENILTSNIFSTESLEEEKVEILFNDKNLLIIRNLILIRSISDLLENYKKGFYKINQYNIRYNSFDPDTLIINIFQQDKFKLVPDTVIFGAERRETLAHIQGIWDILQSKNGYAILEGYLHIFDMIADLTGIVDYRKNYDSDVKFIFPLEVKIKNLTVTDKKFIVDIIKSQNLKDLQLNIKVTRGVHRTNVVFRNRYSIESNNNAIKLKINIDNLYPKDFIETFLISKSLPELIIERNIIWAPIEKPLKPYAITFNMFYPIEELKDRLLNPHRFKKADTIFEEAVSILFALCGFSPIHLGRKYENLKLVSKYEYASTDILGFVEEEGLFLIDCDTQMPDPSKISKLMALKQHLGKNEEIKKTDSIVPVIITPNDCAQFETTISNVVILDRNWIIDALEKIMIGDIKEIARDIKQRQIRPF